MVSIIANSIFCACALWAFIDGAVKYYRPEQALYKKMIASAMGCVFLWRLYETVQLLVIGEVPDGFNVGTLGLVGFFMFFFAANYGAIDSLIDDGTEKMKKYRIIALAAPAFMMAGALVVVLGDATLFDKVSICIEQAFMGLAIYYDFKHIIIPSKYSDMFATFRMYHMVIILMAVAMMVENINWYSGIENMFIGGVAQFIQTILILMIIPSLEKGINRWKI